MIVKEKSRLRILYPANGLHVGRAQTVINTHEFREYCFHKMNTKESTKELVSDKND